MQRGIDALEPTNLVDKDGHGRTSHDRPQNVRGFEHGAALPP
jgi:hypothetical protein